jgi:hypothetical protein
VEDSVLHAEEEDAHALADLGGGWVDLVDGPDR